jgi:hypothetical protein
MRSPQSLQNVLVRLSSEPQQRSACSPSSTAILVPRDIPALPRLGNIEIYFQNRSCLSRLGEQEVSFIFMPTGMPVPTRMPVAFMRQALRVKELQYSFYPGDARPGGCNWVLTMLLALMECPGRALSRIIPGPSQCRDITRKLQ